MATVGVLDLPKEGYEAVIFDCDGTLVNSMPIHFQAWCGALEFFGAGKVFQEDVFYAMGGRPSRDIVADLNQEYGLKLDAETMSSKKTEIFLTRLKEIENIDEVVAFAKDCAQRKIPMAVASGGLRHVVEKTLQHAGISDLFEEVVTGSDVLKGKPEPDVFLRAAELLEVEPEKCLVLEDSPVGMKAAESAGMQAFLVPMPKDSSSL